MDNTSSALSAHQYATLKTYAHEAIDCLREAFPEGPHTSCETLAGYLRASQKLPHKLRRRIKARPETGMYLLAYLICRLYEDRRTEISSAITAVDKVDTAELVALTALNMVIATKEDRRSSAAQQFFRNLDIVGLVSEVTRQDSGEETNPTSLFELIHLCVSGTPKTPGFDETADAMTEAFTEALNAVAIDTMLVAISTNRLT